MADGSVDERIRSLAGDAWRLEEEGDLRAARRAATVAVELSRASSDPRVKAEALRVLGAIQHRAGAFADAESLYARAVELDEAAGDDVAAARDLVGKALALLDRGAVEEAAATLERARDALCARGDEVGLSAAGRALARLARLCRDAASASPLVEGTIPSLRRSDARRDLLLQLCELGHALLASGRSARAPLQEARDLASRIGTRPGSSVDLALLKLELALEAVETGQPGRLFGGELVEDIPSGLRRWLVRAGRLTAAATGAGAPAAAAPERFGAYRVREVLGTGGGGIVYRGEDERTGAAVAIKTVAIADRRKLLLLRREVRALARVRHEGIVRILEEHLDDDTPWYAMELVDGTPLHEHAAAHWHPGRIRDEELHRTVDDTAAARAGPATEDDADGPLPPIPTEALSEILTIVRRLCEALAYLHGEGMVHRDVKPENVVVREDGSPVIVDFGLAAQGGRAGREGLDDAIVRGGTLLYMAPEQIRGEIVDARADLYALGAVLYELLTGRPPFLPDTVGNLARRHVSVVPRPPSALVEGLPAELDLLVMRLLAKDPRDRIGYAEDVANVLHRLGARVSSAPAARPRTYLYQPRLHGRADALALVRGALQSLGRGEGGFVAVGGEVGSGKTRLAMEAARLAAEHGLSVLAGECLEGGPPLGAFRKLLEAIADRCRERGDGGAFLPGLRGQVLAAYCPALARLPFLAGAPEPAELPPDAARLRLYLALQETLDALGAEEPLLFVLEDLQWADELSLDALSFLVHGNLRGLRVLVAATYRTEEAPAPLLGLVQSRESSWITLGPLSEAAISSMVSDMLALVPPPAVFAAHLARHAAGNPFFVAEYLRSAVEEGLLWRDAGGTWQIAQPGDVPATEEDYARLPLPRGLHGLLLRRLDGLPAATRRVADAASVLGAEADLPMLATVAQVSDDDLWEAVSELLQRQVLVEKDGGRIGFAHDQIRQVAYGRIPVADAAAYHQRAAAACEALPPEERPAELPRHLELGGEATRAREAYREAAARARRRYAHAEAERLLRDCLRLTEAAELPAAELCLELASVLDVAGKTADARAELTRAADDAHGRGDVRLEAVASRHLGVLEHESGRLELAAGHLDHAWALAVSLGEPRLVADVLRSLANLDVRCGRLDDAERRYQQVLAMHRASGNEPAEALVLGALGILHFERGDLDRARPLLEEAVAKKRAAGDLRGAALTAGNLGALHARQGRLAEAHAAYEEALAFKQSTGDRRGEAIVLGNIAALHHDHGRYDEALALFESCRTMHRSMGSHRVEGIMASNVGASLFLLGRLHDAERTLGEALAIHRAAGNRRSEGYTLSVLGEIHHASGRFEEAETNLAEALDVHRGLGSGRDQATTLRCLADLRRHAGDLASAGNAVATAVALLREAGDRLELGLALAAQGHAEIAAGRSAAAHLAESGGIAGDLAIGPGSALRRRLDRLSRAEEAHASGAAGELWRGDHRADVPPGVRTWAEARGAW